MTQQPESGQPPVTIDTTVPNSARVWNYWLGGKDHYEAGRRTGGQFSAICPGIVDIARAGRYFTGRVVRFLAGEAGVRQYREVGAGLPAVGWSWWSRAWCR